MKSYRDLDIYKDSKRLAIEIHKMSLLLPKFELYEEGSQVRRSAKAVTSAIVEGYGRKRYKADFIKFLFILRLNVTKPFFHLDFLNETESLKDTSAYEKLHDEYDLLSRRINKFIQWVEASWNDFDND